MKLIREVAEDVQYLTELTESGSKKLFIEGVFLVGDQVNRNNRMYKMDTLRKEVHRYTEELINNNRALGELGHPCFSESAKILTTNKGFVQIKDIDEDEEVFTYNMNTMDVEKQKITKKVVLDYEGQMIQLFNRTFNTLVTPQHRFFIKHRRKNEFKIVTAQEIVNDLQGENLFKYWSILKTSEYNCDEPFDITLNGQPNSRLFKSGVTIPSNVFIKFLGLFLAEGNCTKTNNNTFRISIYQNEGEKSDQIRSLIKELSQFIIFKENIKGNKITWSTSDSRLGNYLYPLGTYYDKYIPTEILNSLDVPHAEELLSWFILGDGRGKLNEKYTKTDCFSVSKQLIEDLSVVATKAGFATRIYSIIPDKDVFIGERVIKKENKSELFFLQILTTKGIYLDKRFIKYNYQDFVGKVYCVQVPNETFFVQDNGYTFWSANCTPSLNLERVSHKIVSLKENGNTFVGKALILETPYGQIAKNLIDNGVKLGVSSRALGTLSLNKEGYNVVNDDLKIFTAADIVADPSAPGAFVNGLMEDKEWILVGETYTEKEFYEDKKQIMKATSKEIENVALKLFENYLRKI